MNTTTDISEFRLKITVFHRYFRANSEGKLHYKIYLECKEDVDEGGCDVGGNDDRVASCFLFRIL